MGRAFRWGILGTGRITGRVLPGFREAGHQLAIVGSSDPARAQAAATALGAERAGDYEAVLAADDIDAIYLALPNGLHAPWAMRAAAAGRHVLCEKPMAPSVEACERMTAAARRHGVHLAEAFMYRHHPRWAIVRRLLDDGTIGPLLTVRAHFGFRLERADDVRLSPALGGGAIQDVGCYAVNAARWFLGEPARVRGVALDRRGAGVETHAAAMLEYGSGALGILDCSFDTPLGQHLALVGERGRIEVPQPFLPSGGAPVQIVTPTGERTEAVPAANQYALQFAAFARLVQDGEPMPTPAEDAAGTQAVIAAWRGG